MAVVGGEVEDPLGLDVEGDSKFPEDQLMVSLLTKGTFHTEVKK